MLSRLEALKINYHNPCGSFICRLELLDQYRYYLEEQGLTFKPKTLTLEFHLPDLGMGESKEDFYTKFRPICAEGLRRLSLTLHGAHSLARGQTEQDKVDRLRFLFDEKLSGLDSFHFNLIQPGNLGWPADDSLCFKKKDLNILEELMPNLKSLSINNCCIYQEFIEGLIKSNLLAKLESLSFFGCIFEVPDRIALWLSSPAAANLKEISLQSCPQLQTSISLNFF